MSKRFIDGKAVVQKICLSKSEIYQRINSGTFPKPIALGPRKVVFLESDIDAWMQARIERVDDGSSRRLHAQRAVSSRRDRNG
ncbi:AlpA family phage regulatory protein [Bradyrhizobium sp. AUGA SZCCT0169]|uniref:helix-turn-helix transcriptional regulator n=1 Tax=Bradyrhizobium sp. AUGA SZCCT0169 TaxID=2807663 RepID=UPI001BA4ED95|nr:AlpA family phage regulatory protein [Bradyrhizobium sp. AUGA SZCCT0169]